VAAGFVAHWFWWRWRRPKRARAVLLVLFPLGALCLAPAIPPWLAALGLAPLGWAGWLNVALAVLAFTLAYVVTYSALEADSPTLGLIRHLAKHGPAGLAEDALRGFFREKSHVSLRLAALAEEEMIVEKEGSIFLAPHPYRLFRAVLFYRSRILRIGEDGG